MGAHRWGRWAALLCALISAPAAADEYLSRDAFLKLAFGAITPELKLLWLTQAQRDLAKTSVGWAPDALRVRYWQAGERTAWILEQIGKEQPITLGVVVAADHIERVDVLAFRESRGWEIRYPCFTAQFFGIAVGDQRGLSKSIDGITGATLSVRAVQRVARMALWLHAQSTRG